jgi:hypothetical protein
MRQLPTLFHQITDRVSGHLKPVRVSVCPQSKSRCPCRFLLPSDTFSPLSRPFRLFRRFVPLPATVRPLVQLGADYHGNRSRPCISSAPKTHLSSVQGKEDPSSSPPLHRCLVTHSFPLPLKLGLYREKVKHKRRAELHSKVIQEHLIFPFVPLQEDFVL